MKAIGIIKVALRSSLVLWYAFQETYTEMSTTKFLVVFNVLVLVGGVAFGWGRGWF